MSGPAFDMSKKVIWKLYTPIEKIRISFELFVKASITFYISFCI